METTLEDIDFAGLTSREFFPSPAAWEDEVLYFLMLDRFSDGQEDGYRDNDGNLVSSGSTPPFSDGDEGNAVASNVDADNWNKAGTRFVGGTLKGLQSKIGYLQRLGVTAVWISPIFKQVPFQETYHGYGIQYYLDVDPRFGSRDELASLVETAHRHGIRVILDIILNHSGDVFGYDPNSARCGGEHCWQSDGTVYPVSGFRDRSGDPGIPFGLVDAGRFPDDAIWPAEFQVSETFTRKGSIRNWDNDRESREGDFLSLKDIRLGQGTVDHYQPSPALMNLCEVFKFWIAFADVDGFRVDTVKHMDDGASRLFTSAVHEFAQSIGKENFYLIAEITGGRQRAFQTLETVGMNAALGINDMPDKIEYLVKGYRNPEDYFNLFRNSMLVNKQSHTWFRDRVVTTFDDHDQVRKGDNKSRFARNEASGQRMSQEASLAVLAFLTTTMGIPCIYYGSEQRFDGHGGNDRYIREAMFGGDFGAFRSKGRHFFDEDGYVYRELAKILKLRKESLVIRRGRQFLRQISGNGFDFGYPRTFGSEIRSIVPWSRIFNKQEVVLAINTDTSTALTAWTTIDNGLHHADDRLVCRYSTNPAQIGDEVVVAPRNGKAVNLTVPASGFVVYS